MTEYPIRIRIGNANAGNYETKTYTDSTFADAVAALQGTHDEYHSRTSVHVVATYAEDHTERRGPKRQIERKAGEPVFGFETTIYGRDVKYGGYSDAETSTGSMGSLSTDQAALMIDIQMLALQLAKAANAEPACPACKAEADKYAARQARLDAAAVS